MKTAPIIRAFFFTSVFMGTEGKKEKKINRYLNSTTLNDYVSVLSILFSATTPTHYSYSFPLQHLHTTATVLRKNTYRQQQSFSSTTPTDSRNSSPQQQLQTTATVLHNNTYTLQQQFSTTVTHYSYGFPQQHLHTTATVFCNNTYTLHLHTYTLQPQFSTTLTHYSYSSPQQHLQSTATVFCNNKLQFSAATLTEYSYRSPQQHLQSRAKLSQSVTMSLKKPGHCFLIVPISVWFPTSITC